MSGESETSEAEASRRRINLALRRPSLAASGFLLSLTLALISAGSAIRGAVIVVQPPEQAILFRDGEGEKSVLTFAVRMAMINATADHGDVVMKSELQPLARGPWFASAATVQPVFTGEAKVSDSCELGARCITLPGLLAVERAEEIVDIPGGAVKARYLSFPATEWNCDGKAAACAAFGRFDAAVDALASRPLDVKVKLHFNSDGVREITCTGRKIDAAYLRKTGWVGVSCKTAKVTRIGLF